MVSEWSGPHIYSALRFGVLRPAAPQQGKTQRQIRAGEEVSGARMSTLGAPACLTSGYRVESWDRYILQDVTDVVLAAVVFPEARNLPHVQMMLK